MSGSTVSVSADQPSSGSARKELIISVNWIGDAIMAMPALQEYNRLHPETRITMLARGMLADLWRLHPVPAEIIPYNGRPGLFDPLFSTLRAHSFERAWLWPNAFRSAWIATRSGIPRRTGKAGGLRSVLVNDARIIDPADEKHHQAWEYLALMVPEVDLKTIPAPKLILSDELKQKILDRMGRWTGSVVGMIPGAARGPSKRWPAGHFVSAARQFIQDGRTVVLFGGPDDVELCNGIVRDVGPGVVSYAGKTNLSEWAALMSSCALVVANDSGGMHLAAALERPVVALYGITNPAKTGPLGNAVRILQHSKHRARDVARDSAEAIASLAAISPDEVVEAARDLLGCARP